MRDSKTLEYKEEHWGRGPWQKEPDQMQWQHRGLSCFMIRSTRGAWHGYVGVNESHAFYEKGYAQCALSTPCGETWCDHCPGSLLSVHGGLIHSGYAAEPMAQIPQPGEVLWWFGFACEHADDLVPEIQAELNRYGLGGLGTYRDVPYVTAEVNRLAEQLVWLARYPTEMGRARKQSFWVTLKHKITR